MPRTTPPATPMPVTASAAPDLASAPILAHSTATAEGSRPAASRLRALRIDPHSSQLELIDGEKLGRADTAGISGTGYRSMTITNGIAMLVDDSAREQSQALNVWATVITHTFGSNAVVFGSTLVFGVGLDERQMRTVTTLQDAQVRLLANAVVGPLDLGVFERLTESLQPFPGALTYLANIGTLAPEPEPATDPAPCTEPARSASAPSTPSDAAADGLLADA